MQPVPRPHRAGLRAASEPAPAMPAGRGTVRARCARWCLLGALGLAAGSAAAQPAPCALVDVARVRAIAPGFVPPLVADAPGTLAPRDLPGLPVPLRLDQCTSAMTAAGAISFRLTVLTVPRALTAAEWAAVGKALDHAEPMLSAAPQCSVEQQSTKHSGTLHSAGCGQTRGRHRVEISFEHPQAAQLPPVEQIRALLAAAMARL